MKLPEYEAVEVLLKGIYNYIREIVELAEIEELPVVSPIIEPEIGIKELDTITNLQVFDIKTSSMKVSWDSVEGATKYFVKWTDGQSKFVVGTSTSIPYLMQDNVYIVSVKAVNDTIEGQASSVTIRTPKTVIIEEPVIVDEPTTPIEPDPLLAARDLNFDMHLMGINLAGHEFGPGTPYYHWPTKSDLELWLNEGYNMIRLPLKWERLQPTLLGDLDAIESTKMIAFLDMAHGYGFKVLTDLHNYLRYNGKVVGVDLPADILVDFWKKFTTLCKGHPALWCHGVMNEPYTRNPQWPVIAQACYDAIQSIEPGRHVAIGGDHWSNAHGWESKNSGLPLKDAKFAVYEFHCYPDIDASGSFKDLSENIKPDAITKRYADVRQWAIKHGVMLLCGEISLAWNMNKLETELEPRGSQAIRNGLTQMVDDGVPIFWWAGGSRWTSSSVNATQFKLDIRFPINIMREFKNKFTRKIGPNL